MYTRCEPDARAIELGTALGVHLGLCVGTGQAPTCALPPPPFSGDNTAIEIQWGSSELGPGNASVRYPLARDPETPYPGFIQVVMTPLVANLDDDNGDGLINENDIPEILFVAMDHSSYQNDGVLRAIHGGGPRKGRDYFANCGGATERWLERDLLAGGTGFLLGDGNCTRLEAKLDPTAGIAVGDLDYDGVPEIVAIGEGDPEVVFIFSNEGELITSSLGVGRGGAEVAGENPYPTLANLDGKGFAEIIVGDAVFMLEHRDGRLDFAAAFYGGDHEGRNSLGPISCVFDIDDDGSQEIIAGRSIYRLPDIPEGPTQSSCSGNDFCDGKLVLVRRARDLSGADIPHDGFCATADLLGQIKGLPPGPDNPLDGKVDVVLVAANKVYVFDPREGQTYFEFDLPTLDPFSIGGGAPNVDDFDGDGFPEIGTAARDGYTVLDLQASTGAQGDCPSWPIRLRPEAPEKNRNPPRVPHFGSCQNHSDCGAPQFGCNTITHECTCLHNGWVSNTEDDSSRVTGSSVFDFNGDGVAEVVYNDECKFRVYEGNTGRVLLDDWSESRTRSEYPVVADVDRDGNAEIIFATTTESQLCSARNTVLDDGRLAAEKFNAGIEVWGDLNDLWVPARRVWNQHAYHVTNVTESAQIPRFPPRNLSATRGRNYNSYRSNPRNYGVAPDLTITSIQYTSPDTSCGAIGRTLDVMANVRNAGDLLVGGDSLVAFFGDFGQGFVPLLDQRGRPLEVPLGKSLGARQMLSVVLRGYDPAHPSGNRQQGLPERLRVRVDSANIETECNDERFGVDNNEAEVVVQTRPPLPDLEVELTSLSCSEARATVKNRGAAPVEDAEVALFHGDPNGGGREVTRTTTRGTLAPGETRLVTFTGRSGVPPPWSTPGRNVMVYAVVDPDNRHSECDDSNNQDVRGPLLCAPILK